MAEPIRIELETEADGRELIETLARRGLVARPLRTGSRFEVELHSPREETRRLLLELEPALELWLADREQVSVALQVGARSLLVRGERRGGGELPWGSRRVRVLRAERERKEESMATIVRWNPWRELEQMQHHMRRMFEGPGLAPGAFPAADVYETESEVVVEIEAPGFEEKEIDVEVTDHTLVIKGGRYGREGAEREVLLAARAPREHVRAPVRAACGDRHRQGVRGLRQGRALRARPEDGQAARPQGSDRKLTRRGSEWSRSTTG